MNFFKAFFAALLGFFVGVVLLLFLLLIWVGALVANADKKDTSVASNSVLTLRLDRPIADRTIDDPFSKLNPNPLYESNGTLGLNDILLSIRKAKTDDRIKGIYLNTQIFGGGIASAESIHDALVDFKTSGKFIYSYSEYMTEGAYTLASVADSIFIYPTGALEWNGIGSTPLFVRGMFDKIGVEPMVFKVGTFKSATEMFTERQMSAPAREQASVFLTDMWKQLLSKIGKQRNLAPEALDQLATSFAVTDAKSALEHKLIDGLKYEDEVIALINKRTGRAENKKLIELSPSTYAEAIRESAKESENVIAVVYGEGEIASGEASSNSIGSKTLVEALRRAREDKSVKAIVFRVNSPGGSSLASDVIAREVQLAKAEKPVIASFGDVAASGGYYIAAHADQIVAQPTTITGSIGIFGLLFNTQKMFNDKLGITFDRVSTNPYADLGNPNRPMTDFERRKIQGMVNEGYGDFINVVKTGRKFADSISVDKIAQGRVWSGTRALGINLVDTLGGLDVAIAIAAKKAGLGDEYEVREYPRIKTAFERITEDFMSTATEAFESIVFTPEQRTMLRVRRMLNDPHHIYARSIDYNVQ